MSQDPTTGSVLIPATGDIMYDGGHAEDDPHFSDGAPVAETIPEAIVTRELTTVVPHNEQPNLTPDMPYRTAAQLEAADAFHLNRAAEQEAHDILLAFVGQAQHMGRGVVHWRTSAAKAEQK